MRVEQLIEELRQLPQTAHVVVRVRDNVGADGTVEPLYEFRDESVDGAIYSYDTVVITLDENSAVKPEDHL